MTSRYCDVMECDISHHLKFDVSDACMLVSDVSDSCKWCYTRPPDCGGVADKSQ